MSNVKTNAHNVDFNKVVADYKAGIIDFNQFYNTFYVEKKRFMTVVAQGKPELEAVFDDTLMAVLDEWQEGNSFIGLLRVRLNSRVKDYFRAEAKKKYYEQQHVEQYARFTHSPQMVKQHEVEFMDYLQRLDDPVLYTACQLLIAGYKMNEAAKKVGIKDMRTLKSRLQKAFEEFLDK
jgi:DNA-directed RNA polymerase specialized sigma24 family protein